MRKLLRIGYTVCFIVLINACSTVQFGHLSRTDPLYLERAGKGHLLVKDTKTQKVTQSVQIRLQWTQSTERTQLDILSPFGTSYGQFLYDPKEGTQLVTPLGTQKGKDAEQLLKKHIGFVMPVSGMRYWVKGLIVPDVAVDFSKKDDQGRCIEIGQQGWDIKLSDYDQQGPKKIQMHRHMPDGQLLSVQLVF